MPDTTKSTVQSAYSELNNQEKIFEDVKQQEGYSGKFFDWFSPLKSQWICLDDFQTEQEGEMNWNHWIQSPE